MNADKWQEQRQTPRYPVTCPVMFAVDGVSGAGMVLNLSEDGCAVESSVPVSDDGSLSISVTFPGEKEPVSIPMARLCWMTRTAFGCQFLILSRTARERLQRYLRCDRAA